MKTPLTTHRTQDLLRPSKRMRCPSEVPGESHIIQSAGSCAWDTMLQRPTLVASFVHAPGDIFGNPTCVTCHLGAQPSDHKVPESTWRAQRFVWFRQIIQDLKKAHRQLSSPVTRILMSDLTCPGCRSQNMTFDCLWEASDLGQPEDAKIVHWDGLNGSCASCQARNLVPVQTPIGAHRALALSAQINDRVADLRERMRELI